MRNALLLLGVLTTVGCATVEPVGSPEAAVEQVRERNYALGVQRTAAVGEPIVRVREYTLQKGGAAAVQANKAFAIRGCLHDIRFTEGERRPISGKRQVGGQSVYVVRKEGYQMGLGNVLGIQVFEDGRIHNKVLTAFNTEGIYVCRPEPADARLIPVRGQITSQGAPYSNYEIIFNGSDGQAMQFTYREYSPEDLARTAFFQNLSYPVGSKTIRFRKLVIDVAGLNEQTITYAVRSDQ